MAVSWAAWKQCGNARENELGAGGAAEIVVPVGHPRWRATPGYADERGSERARPNSRCSSHGR